MKNQYQKVVLGIFVLGTLFFSTQVIGVNIKLKPIKPSPGQSTGLTDEQQAVAAVRMAKPAVVSIVGNKVDQNTSQPMLDLNIINGTGFIINPDGLIVSNSHVVADSQNKYFVVFADGTQYEAKVLGADKYNDIALLKIEASNLPASKLGDSDILETGQTVFAIGNSAGKYQNTVTRGVVSALGRAIGLGSESNPQPRLQNLIQTDAAINSGNSGGPVINLLGEVVGMSTLVDRSGEGLGFAIPVNVIKTTVQQILDFGKVSRPYLGVSFTTVNKALQSLKQLSVSEGAYVKAVAVDSPAQRAGIIAGDVIVEINRQKLTLVNEMDKALYKLPVGTTIVIGYIRNGAKEEAVAVLGEFK
jgi:serine protease Do